MTEKTDYDVDNYHLKYDKIFSKLNDVKKDKKNYNKFSYIIAGVKVTVDIRKMDINTLYELRKSIDNNYSSIFSGHDFIDYDLSQISILVDKEIHEKEKWFRNV